MDLIRRIRPEKTGVRAPLGELEASVMQHVWPCGESGCFAAQVQQALSRDRPVALTTVLTTLDRLHDKGILFREREGKAYRYRAALSEAELQQRIVSGVLGELIAQFPQAVAAYFAGKAPEAVGNFPQADEQEVGDAELDLLARRLEALRAARATNHENNPSGEAG